MRPTIFTPWSCRPNKCTTTLPKTTAASGAGTTGANLRSTRTIASDTSPTSRVIQLVWPSLVTKVHSCWKKSPDPFSTPTSFGSWPAMIGQRQADDEALRHRPGDEVATNPSRASPAASASTPVVRASVTVSAANTPALPAAVSPTAAADSAAVAAIGPTTRRLELPNAA